MATLYVLADTGSMTILTERSELARSTPLSWIAERSERVIESASAELDS